MTGEPGSLHDVDDAVAVNGPPGTAAARDPVTHRQAPGAYVWLLAAVLLLALFLRFYRLDASSLWSDEGNTWAMIGRSFAAIAQAAAADIHPPGYYWLLKAWSLLWGTSAFAMRSFSAVAGIALVFVIERIGQQVIASGYSRWRWPLLAAFLAAVNPFQVYYSQEARMYILLALESAGLFWALLAIQTAEQRGPKGAHKLPPRLGGRGGLSFVLCGIAGLWTHYSFPIVLAAADLAFFVRWAAEKDARRSRSLLHFVLLNALIGIAFLPWLPFALPAVLNWPKGGAPIGLGEGLALTARTLLFGPLRNTPAPLWPWLLAAAVLPLAGAVVLRRRWSVPALSLWLLLPVLLMAVLGLFTDAFLKFLLVTSPAWCLLVAATALARVRWSPVVGALVALFGAAAALAVLPGYYAGDTARDNYKGIAQYLAAVGDPAQDLVLLDAPGQQEVWRYYDPGLPVLALPTTRPANAAETQAALATATRDRRHVYALFWATDEADPERLVEAWLDRNAFKALDAWQGNLRLASYTLANDLTALTVPPLPFGDAMALVSQAQPAFPQRVLAGENAIVRLDWQALRDIDQPYKVSVQLLDARNQLVAQRDGEPVGGSRPTDTWRTGDQIADNYALPIPFGTPPGDYRLMVAVYDPATGARLLRGAQDHLDLGTVVVARPSHSPPLAVVPMQQRPNRRLGPVWLGGYDVYRKEFAHAPQTPVQAGDPLHFTFFWQAPDPLPADWPADGSFTVRLGGQELTAPLAGGAYPTGLWQPGELVRGEFDLLYDGTAVRPTLRVGGQEITLEPLP